MPVESTNKILLVSNKVFHYRVPVYNYLNRRLRSIGYELVVLTNELQSANPHRVEFELFVQPFAYGRYVSRISQVQPTHVILFLHIRDLVVWPLMLWLKQKKFRFIYWNHGINLQTPNNRIKNLIFRVFHAMSDAILLYSAGEIQHIAAVHRKKVFIANNTIDFGSIPEIGDSKEEIRAELGITFEKVVLFVGRITKAKKLDDLIDAAEFLDRGNGVAVVGGVLTKKQVSRIDRAENVVYLGEIYDGVQINRIFKMADVFCIPGKIGLGINHAFYWGLPVVTEAVRHAPEIIYLKDGQNGFVVDRGDITQLAEKLNLLLSSNDTYQRFSRAAREEILQNANMDVMCDGFVEAINYLDTGNRRELVRP